jgi:hypothetical protein
MNEFYEWIVFLLTNQNNGKLLKLLKQFAIGYGTY